MTLLVVHFDVIYVTNWFWGYYTMGTRDILPKAYSVVISTHTLYLEEPQFKSPPGHWLT